MSKKDYVAIAGVIHDAEGCNRCRQDIAERLVTILAEDNPRFDRERFLVACGFSVSVRV